MDVLVKALLPEVESSDTDDGKGSSSESATEDGDAIIFPASPGTKARDTI